MAYRKLLPFILVITFSCKSSQKIIPIHLDDLKWIHPVYIGKPIPIDSFISKYKPIFDSLHLDISQFLPLHTP